MMYYDPTQVYEFIFCSYFAYYNFSFPLLQIQVAFILYNDLDCSL